MEKLSIQYPIITLNGNKAQTLAEEYHEIVLACENLREKMLDATPHGRNYQSANHTTDYNKALEEHRERLRALSKITKEVESLRDFCLKQVK